MLLGAAFTPCLTVDGGVGTAFTFARFLGDFGLVPSILPLVFLPFGGLASGSFVFFPLFGRLRRPWLVGFLGPRVRCPRVSKCVLRVSGFSCAWGGFLFGVIPFGFDSSSGGHDEAGFKNALFRYSRLTGEIPPELGNLANLSKLQLDGNQLSGCMPSSLSDQLNMGISDLGGLRFCL